MELWRQKNARLLPAPTGVTFQVFDSLLITRLVMGGTSRIELWVWGVRCGLHTCRIPQLYAGARWGGRGRITCGIVSDVTAAWNPLLL